MAKPFRFRIVVPLVVSLVIGAVAPVDAAWSLVSSTCQGSSNAADFTTTGLSTTGADLEVAIIGSSSSSATLTSSPSNTWTCKTSVGGNPAVRLCYAFNASVSGSQTFTTSTGGGFPSICVGAFSGSQTSSDPFDNEGTGALCGSCTSIAMGTITQTGADLFVTGLGTLDPTTTNVSINNSFTIANSVGFLNGTHYGVQIAWKSASASQAPTWTDTASGNLTTVGDSFLPGSGGGGGGGSGTGSKLKKLCALGACGQGGR